MIITQQQFYREFRKICKISTTHSTCKLAIFVSCFDVDSICSARMLSDYLKRQFIVFQIVPVIGYIDLREKYLKLESEIANVILIGCGATADLESFLEIDISDYLGDDMTPDEAALLIHEGRLGDVKLTRKLYVIDGHRPWNLDNLYGSPIVLCLDDNTTEGMNAERKAFYFLINVPEEEEEDEEEVEIEDLATDNDEDNDLILNEPLERKRTRQALKESKKKKQKRLVDEYQEVLENYYQQGSTVSIPSSHQTYDLLSTIGEINIDSLWLAIVGTRSLRDVYRKVYDLVYPGLKNEVQRLQVDIDAYTMRSSNSNNALITSSALNFDISKKADNHGLQSCKEYTLFLLHYWTLYDSFFYSEYVNSKCHLYTNDGRRLLKTLFARMGIPLIQATQNWHYLDLELKRKLDSLVLREAWKFNLREIIIDGFKRNYGFHGSISSGDYVNAVQALLEHGTTRSITKKKVQSNRDDENGGPSGTNNEDNGEEHEDKNQHFLNSFWRAYDSLNNYSEIKKGMEIAKYQQQFIFEKGSEIIQKGMVKTQSKFRVVILNESFTMNSSITKSNNSDSTFNKSMSSLKDDRVVDITTFGNGSQMFQNPLILTKLGNWILNVQADLDEGVLPLVIGAYNSETKTYLVCGLPSRASFDLDGDEEEEEGADDDDDDNSNTSRKNRKDSKKVNKQHVILNAFSVLFEKVTQEINIQARMDSFQSAIIELRKEDLTKFLDGLTRYSQYML